MKLTRYEQETIIRYSQASETVEIFTCSQRLKSRLNRLGLTPYHQNSSGGNFYRFEGRRFVSIRNPHRKAPLT